MRPSRLYWTCQAAGWGAFTLYALTGYVAAVGRAHIRYVDVTSFLFFDWVVCTLATHGLRAWMRTHGWLDMPARRLAPRLAAAVGLLAGSITAAVVLGIALTRQGRTPPADYIAGMFIAFALAMSGWLAIYFQVVSRRRQRTREGQALELSIVARDAQLRALRAQINPHFLFNALNSLRGLIAEDPPRAASMVTGFAGLMRYALQSDRTETVTLAEELAAVDDYLELERMRFEERLRVERAVSPDARDARLPPMLLQLLVENAIKHGVATLREGGVVRIDAAIADAQLQLRVSNSGVLSRGNGTGVGLDNARERLRLLYGTAASLALDADEGMVVATLRIPLTGSPT
jgi:hypothetical protein